MKNLAIIPARGGSKRIPKKNIKNFLGKPIIAYSIEAALKSELFDEVMVSTDNQEIANLSIKYGAKVPFFRSAVNSDDFATMADVLEEVVDQYKKQRRFFDCVCSILPTAPLLSITNLKKGYELLNSGRFESVRSITAFSYPIQRALEFKNEEVSMFNPEHLRTRSQDLPAAYYDAAQFYWFFFNKGLLAANKGAIVLKNIEIQDIDTKEDWEIAELKYKVLFQKKLDDKN